MKTFLKSLVALLLLTTAAAAQSVQQSGAVTNGHAAMWSTTGVISDAGVSTNGKLKTIGVTTNTNDGCGIGINDGPILAGYHELCFGFNAGAGVISFQNYGGAAATPLDLVINGTTYGIGGTNWLSAIIDQQLCSIQGSVIYRNATVWTCLNPGSSGQVLQTLGPNSNPQWASGGGTGSVTSITAGTGLTGGTITSSGTIALSVPVTAANGGTGVSTIAAHGVVIGNGTGAVNAVTPGASGTILQSNGVSADPTWNVVTGTGTVTSITAADATITVTPTPLITTGTIAVATNGVANANLAQMAANTIKGNNTGSTANAADLTVQQTNTLLGNQPPPQGRLTLQTGVPVMTSDQTAKSTVYYDCYIGNRVSIFNGTDFLLLPIVGCEISMGLDSVTPHIASGSLYDIYGFSSSGALAICAGPAWSNATSRGTGAGTTEITNTNGIWTNANALTHCWGGVSGTTDFGSIAANRATYLGTIYATSNGQTGMAFKPSAASGGTNNFLGLYNAYNKVLIYALCRDSTASWTYSTATWRSANNNNSNRISFVDGLQQSNILGTYDIGMSTSGGQNGGAGAVLDSTSTPPDTAVVTSNSSTLAASAHSIYSPQLGLHFLQAIEFAQGATVTYFGTIVSQTQGLFINLEM